MTLVSHFTSTSSAVSLDYKTIMVDLLCLFAHFHVQDLSKFRTAYTFLSHRALKSGCCKTKK